MEMRQIYVRFGLSIAEQDLFLRKQLAEKEQTPPQTPLLCMGVAAGGCPASRSLFLPVSFHPMH